MSREHIERHGSFTKYREAKGKLFRACKNIHIINRDDENAEYFWSFPAKKKISYRYDPSLNLKLPGKFNNYNASAAIEVGLSQGIDLEICKRAVEKIESIPGRMEIVIKEPFKVVVDYAHTPDALEKVYKTLVGHTMSNGHRMSNRLICVLGSAGGGRDKWKRPELGRIVAQYCDKIILTNEDPYDEDPEEILDQIEKGIGQSTERSMDRREAIGKALGLAKSGDTVIITGKGSETWMCLAKGKKIPWDDRQIIKDMLN